MQQQANLESHAAPTGSNPTRLDAQINRRALMEFDSSNLGGEGRDEEVDNDTPEVQSAAGKGKGTPRNDSFNLRDVTLCEAGSTLLLAGRVLLCSLLLVCCGTYVLGNLRKRRS